MSEDDDREMRPKSKDNERFDGDRKKPGKLHSKEANTRMAGGKAGKVGSGAMADDDITLAGHGPDGGAAEVSKQDDGVLPAGNDVDEIASDLLELDDEETARAIARVIVRTGDVVGDLAASMEDGGTRMNDRMGRAD